MAQSSTTFTFSGYDLDRTKGLARFYFDLERKNEAYRFVETLRFPARGIRWNDIPHELIKRILNDLSFAFGISYWKLYCLKDIETPFTSLTKNQAAFWNAVYIKGLGEFYYKNKIDFRGLVEFPHELSTDSMPRLPRPSLALRARNDGALKNRSLLQLGGGKDSIVSAELLKKAKKPFTLFMLNESPLQRRVAKLVGTDSIIFTRTLDPQLFTLNAHSDTFNGHVPISVLYAFSGLFAAILYDYRFVIASNEASASYGNIRYKGAEINHQWSKSVEFELLFRNYVGNCITPDVTYFSLLRPFDEMQIARMFSRHTKYFSTFSSCNENFKIIRPLGTASALRTTERWCGHCPKCAFVFTSLAAYLPKKEVVRIFGKNLFAEPRLALLFQELLGIKNFKPFECVGTPEETRHAFTLASERGEYRDDAIMKVFEKTFGKEDVSGGIRKPRRARSDTLPKEFRGLIGEYASTYLSFPA